MTEDEMAGWHHQLDGHKFEQTLGGGEEQEAWCTAVQGVGRDLAAGQQSTCGYWALKMRLLLLRD